jgi:hypothetical protein
LKEGTAESFLKMVIEEVQQVIFCPEGLAQRTMQLSKLYPAPGLHNGTSHRLAFAAVGQHTLRGQPRAQGERGVEQEESIIRSILKETPGLLGFQVLPLLTFTLIPIFNYLKQ